MEILLIKNLKGKDLLVFSKDDINEYNEMGDKVDDFEILQVLGKGTFGFVAKVKSRLNRKIYAMKEIDFSTIKDPKIIEFSENETKILAKLNNEYIIKYYKSIKEGNKLYIIMEFMNNGDLLGMIKANKILEKPIKEEKLYEIFIQAMKSLSYIHSKKLVHRDIKPGNLFISLDGKVKLGDFGVSAAIVEKKEQEKNLEFINDSKNENIKESIVGELECNQTIIGTPQFMSPEMINEEKYDLKTDVYSMGVTFFLMCFWQVPRIPTLSPFDGKIKVANLQKKYNVNEYSKELTDIIDKMIDLDKNKRPDSSKILKLLTVEFNKKYARNSSIGSVISCLYAYENFTEYLLKPKIKEFINNNPTNKPISFAYLYGLNLINKYISEDWNNSLCRIRNVLTTENNRYSGNKEVETRYILSYFLGKMHKELNSKSKEFVRKGTVLFEYKNKNEALQNFINYSQKNNKSAIFDFFYGTMKTKTICNNCQKANKAIALYSFNNFYFVSFNLELAQKKSLLNVLNLEELFRLQNNICIKIDANKLKFCNECKSFQAHYQIKQFYCFPHFLIICLDRGYKCKNKNKVMYDLNLNLKKCYELNGSPFNFQLIGIVKRLDIEDKEHYIALYLDYKTKSWFLRNDSSLSKINSPMEHNEGIEMIFFYKEITN